MATKKRSLAQKRADESYEPNRPGTKVGTRLSEKELQAYDREMGKRGFGSRSAYLHAIVRKAIGLDG